MRIISGTLGGRKINPPANMPYTRPTTDIAKQGLFNILQNRIDFDDIKTLDLFGGTGSISYELASRGAGQLIIIEKDKRMFDFIKSSIEKLQIENCKLIQADAFSFLSSCKEQFDFIFAGPPYALKTIDELPKIIIQQKLLNNDGIFVLEHTLRNDYKNFNSYSFQRNYGTTVFSFFINNNDDKS